MDPTPPESNAGDSPHPDSPGDAERDFRRRWYEAHHERFVADQEGYREQIALTDGFAASADEALELLAELKRTLDLQLFVEGMRAWAVKPTTLAFNGFAGQMLLNQLLKRSSNPADLARLLSQSLTVPSTDAEAVGKIEELRTYVEAIKEGAHPAPGHVPFLLSYFWALADRVWWPVIWSSAASFIEFVTGEDLPGGPAERYQTYLSRVRELSNDYKDFEMTAAWWQETWPVFLDEVLVDRADFGLNVSESTTAAQRKTNALALLSTARNIGESLVEEVSEALGRELEYHVPGINWSPDYPRGDLWVDWRIPDLPEVSGLGVRVWVNHRGAAVALRPTLQRKGWLEQIRPIIEGADYPDCCVIGTDNSKIGEDFGFYGSSGEFVYGRWFDRHDFANLDLPATVVEVATQLRPLFEELLSLALSEGSQSGDRLAPSKAPEALPSEEALDDLADEMLVERSFLDDIVALLKRKRQVVFYGPPGTGKTYLARKLAKVLAPDPDCRATVQFHPASSYEDFFEGYRPAEGEGGELTYRLTPGPLARMAEKAVASPGIPHVMIIDEINRANLPKVLGELLFLLEYRDESVKTLYRPNQGFRLPKNLWFIGTMNTADRSIALVDAALRRRFQFVQFVPDEPPMAGLLDRWLEANGQPAWVGELVAQVNEDLKDDLRGSHLLLGPSYFMEHDLNEDALRRIWEFNIEPLLADQFFGDREQIDRYRFENVYRRHREHSRADDGTGSDDDFVDAAGAEVIGGGSAEG